MHTRIKICGLTRHEDVAAAVAAGADAIGFVFYPKSPRFVSASQAAELIAELPPFVTSVGLFVNTSQEELAKVLDIAPLSLLQFHGDETQEECIALAHQAKRPFMAAYRVRADTSGQDLLQCEHNYRAASPLFSSLLLDTYVDAYGGAGKVFDWSLIPNAIAPQVVLSGGLTVQNVAGAIAQVGPCAVDVSSGVESAKGIKDAAKIRAFIAQVRQADIARRELAPQT